MLTTTIITVAIVIFYIKAENELEIVREYVSVCMCTQVCVCDRDLSLYCLDPLNNYKSRYYYGYCK